MRLPRRFTPRNDGVGGRDSHVVQLKNGWIPNNDRAIKNSNPPLRKGEIDS